MCTEDLQTAERWCESRGPGCSLVNQLGQGGTAPVFEIDSPEGKRALKLYSAEFSAGQKGEVEQLRVKQQLGLIGHDCPSLVQIYDGGEFEGRLFLLMGRASGQELEKRLIDVPRERIRSIVDQVARAAIFLRDRYGMCHRDIKSANVFISDDFAETTLLDVSVVRGIHDPIGIGTDHEGQLPVVATARYSPPEYLFRLLETGPDLWNALTIYQLGGLLHDLIMREPLFMAEYSRSKENRYRFAWVVATTMPTVEASDVDQDLIFLARRALDKDWKKRSNLSIEDFLSDRKSRQRHALELLGLAGGGAVTAASRTIPAKLARIREVAATLEYSVLLALRKQGVTATHSTRPGPNDRSKVLQFSWKPSRESSDPEQIDLELGLGYAQGITGEVFSLSATLGTTLAGKARSANIALPDTSDDQTTDAILASNVESAILSLAIDLTKADTAG